MARPQEADPVKLLVGILWGQASVLRDATELLIKSWGEIDFTGPDRPFDTTNYYEPEMGRNLQRRIVSFQKLVPPDSIVGAKHLCNGIEDKLSGPAGRTVNLDSGYLDHNKLVLASFKGAGQKIYLCDGVWADLVARYRGGRYVPFEWTFPDFRDGRYDPELLEIRQIYMDQRKAKT